MWLNVFKSEVLNSYFLWGIVLSVGDAIGNKEDMTVALMQFTLYERKNIKQIYVKLQNFIFDKYHEKTKKGYV